MGGRPGEHQVGAHVLGPHHAISATVGLTGNNSNLADGGFRVSIQQFRPTANDAVVFLAGAGEEAGHIDKLDDGNVEGITGADKSCGFLCRSNIQTASKFGGLVGHHAHGSAFDPAKANDDIAGVAFLDFEEVAIINHVGDDIFHVVWLVGRIGNNSIKFQIGIGDVFLNRSHHNVSGLTWRLGTVICRQVAHQIPHPVERIGIVRCRIVGGARGAHMCVRATQFFLGNNFTGHGLNNIRSGDKHF